MNSRVPVAARFAGVIVSAALLLLDSAQLVAKETVSDKTLGFTLQLPDGFASHPALNGTHPDLAHAFVLGNPNDSELDILLIVEKLPGTIGRERINPEKLPPGFKGRLFTTKWKEFEVDAFEVPESVNGIQTVTYNVQIPLKRAAIQLKLFGPVKRDAELKKLLPEILAGLDGESNWKTSAFPTTSLASSEHYGLVLLAIGIVVVIGGVIGLYMLSRKSPRGTTLMIAVVIFAIGQLINGDQREVLMLSGAIRFLGALGIILGLIDLFRKRPAPDIVPGKDTNV